MLVCCLLSFCMFTAKCLFFIFEISLCWRLSEIDHLLLLHQFLYIILTTICCFHPSECLHFTTDFRFSFFEPFTVSSRYDVLWKRCIQFILLEVFDCLYSSTDERQPYYLKVGRGYYLAQFITDYGFRVYICCHSAYICENLPVQQLQLLL